MNPPIAGLHHRQRLAGDVAGVIAGQEKDGTGYSKLGALAAKLKAAGGRNLVVISPGFGVADPQTLRATSLD